MASVSAIAIAMAVALGSWVLASSGTGSARAAMSAGILAVLAACHGGMRIDGTAVGLVPGGLTLLVALPCWRAGAVLALVIPPGTARRLRLRYLLASAAVFAAIMLVLALLVGIGTTRADPITIVPGALALYAVAAGIPYLRATHIDMRGGEKSPLAVIARAGLAALAVLTAAGAVLGGGAFALHAGRARELSEQVGGGVGGLPLAMLGALFVPNAVVAGMAYLAGPGFVVGAGTTVSATSTAVGVVPAFPLLAALPSRHGASPVVMALMVIAPLVAGAVVVRMLWRQLPYPGVLAMLLGTLGAAMLSGLGAGLLGWLSAGGIGSGRLAEIGAPTVAFAVYVTGEVAGSGVIALGVLGIARAVTGRRAGAGLTLLSTAGAARDGDKQGQPREQEQVQVQVQEQIDDQPNEDEQPDEEDRRDRETA
jgi:hypothetical protein